MLVKPMLLKETKGIL